MRFEVKALGVADQVSTLVLDAPDASAAAAQAAEGGYAVLGVTLQRPWRVAAPRKAAFPLVLFSQELLALLEAGLSLVESLGALAEKERQPAVRAALVAIVGSLREGHPLSHALEHAPAAFPALYVATVRASERSGGLAEALSRYVAYQMQMDRVRRQVVSASIYPLLLAAVGLVVTVFLMGYVVPRFSHIYAEMGGSLPLASRWLMGWGRLVDRHGGAVAAVGAIAAAGSAFVSTRPATRRWLLRRIWDIPALGARLYVFQLARFYRSLGMLLRDGMPVLPSIEMTADLLRGSMRVQLQSAANSIREGHALSGAMERYGLTTPVAARLLRVGERTGRMGEMMERIAAFYEDDTARWVERVGRFFEPLLMVFIGLIIGAVVLAMYFPIFELAGSIQ